MKVQMKVKAFKNELRNYNYYVGELTEISSSIDWCYHMLGADAKAIDYSKQQSQSIPNKDFEYKIRDDIERYEYLKRMFQSKLNYIDDVLCKMDPETRWATKCVYVEGKQLRYIASQMYVGHSTLQYRINRELAKALK